MNYYLSVIDRTYNQDNTRSNANQNTSIDEKSQILDQSKKTSLVPEILHITILGSEDSVLPPIQNS